MIRDLKKMASKSYDVVIVGGGITGACVARDAALRGLSVALVEKKDFAHATSAASSKLIHGGLRYLKNGELRLVRESLRERRIWLTIAPHMVTPISFVVPTTGFGMKGRFLMSLALRFYDMLSYDRSRVDDPDKRIPSHYSLNREETIALEPGLDSKRLTGAMVFHDCQMYAPERMTLECIRDAVAHGADVANYAEVAEFTRQDKAITGVVVNDVRDPGSSYTIHGRVIVNAAGPWADLLMGVLQGSEPARRLIRSKGIHLITRSLTNGNAISVLTKTDHFFILPWRGHSLIGTTDVLYEGHPDDFRVTEEDIVQFLDLVNRGFPSAKLTRADVLHAYGGLRPLVDTETKIKTESAVPKSTYGASRAPEVFDHERHDGTQGAITTIGGKWTTSRALAERVVDLTLKKLGKPGVPCETGRTPIFGGHVGRFSDFVREAIERHSTLPEKVVENLARNYGSRM
ncbi:MAG: glycerol-3-phosphate dehydrogenase/oxidase, partial [Candidatus Hydrogenedentes bacterium]|nr:glycerol-3-phosphate dehydrogenase/oxidase [Candidatus Hydrogenedentota bacterium]